jgi:hypothetical protein
VSIKSTSSLCVLRVRSLYGISKNFENRDIALKYLILLDALVFVLPSRQAARRHAVVASRSIPRSVVRTGFSLRIAKNPALGVRSCRR